MYTCGMETKPPQPRKVSCRTGRIPGCPPTTNLIPWWRSSGMNRTRGSGGPSKSDRDKRRIPLTEGRSTATSIEDDRWNALRYRKDSRSSCTSPCGRTRHGDRPGNAWNLAIVQARQDLTFGRVHDLPDVRANPVPEPIRQRPVLGLTSPSPRLQPVPHCRRQGLFCLCPISRPPQLPDRLIPNPGPDRIVHRGATSHPNPSAKSRGRVRPPRPHHPGSWLCSGRNGANCSTHRFWAESRTASIPDPSQCLTRPLGPQVPVTG